MQRFLELAAQNRLLKNIATILIILLGTCLLTGLVSVRSWYKPTIQLNEVSPVDIFLDHDATVEDRESTIEKKEKARLQAIKNTKNKEILEIDREAQASNLGNLRFVIKVARDRINSKTHFTEPLNPKVSTEVQNFLVEMSESNFNSLLLINDFDKLIENKEFFEKTELQAEQITDELKLLNTVELKYFLEKINKLRDQEAKAKEIIKSLGKAFFMDARNFDMEKIFMKAYSVQKKLTDLGIVRGMSRSKIHNNIKILFPELDQYQRFLIEHLIDVSTQPNIVINWEKVKELEKDAVSSIEPVKIELQKGSLLAEKGKVIEKQNYVYLKELSMLHAETDWKEISNNFHLITLIIMVIAIFLTITKFKRYTIQQILMMFLVPVSISAVIAPIAIWDVDKLALAPVATISILLTVFYMPTMANVVVCLICFFLAKTVDMNFWQILPQLVGSLYAGYLVRKAHQREDLANAGTKIAISQVITFLLTVMVAVDDFQVTTVLFFASLYGVGALASGFISLAALPYLESSLKLLTPFKLAELSNPNQALLKRLKEEAPGTYQHSLNVSRLSEEAGNALNLNTELIRVGLLYHDIGKMHAPDYFIENTLGKPNPHTTLDDPMQSAKIIIDHVPEGIKLAKKYNLPQAIVDFIPMHQGTTVTNYFYIKAMEKLGEKNVSKESFRYPGPKPNSKETGVAMIADSSEAALRSIKDLDSETKAKEIIYKIINARLEEGELEFSGLSRHDLDTIANSFIAVWRSLNHERVKYPEAKEPKT